MLAFSALRKGSSPKGILPKSGKITCFNLARCEKEYL
jgi:hypothetical protein